MHYRELPYGSAKAILSTENNVRKIFRSVPWPFLSRDFFLLGNFPKSLTHQRLSNLRLGIPSGENFWIDYQTVLMKMNFPGSPSPPRVVLKVRKVPILLRVSSFPSASLLQTSLWEHRLTPISFVFSQGGWLIETTNSRLQKVFVSHRLGLYASVPYSLLPYFLFHGVYRHPKLRRLIRIPRIRGQNVFCGSHKERTSPKEQDDYTIGKFICQVFEATFLKIFWESLNCFFEALKPLIFSDPWRDINKLRYNFYSRKLYQYSDTPWLPKNISPRLEKIILGLNVNLVSSSVLTNPQSLKLPFRFSVSKFLPLKMQLSLSWKIRVP